MLTVSAKPERSPTRISWELPFALSGHIAQHALSGAQDGGI